MDKQFLVDQLTERLREAVAVARQAQKAATKEAREGATPAEKREDARVSQENSMLARGQARRADALIAELQTLIGFRPPRVPPETHKYPC